MTNHAKILVVEDEPNVRLVFRTALEGSGYSVDESDEGRSALHRLRETHYDLVLLDLLMPGMGGMEVLSQLRDAENDVPVVIVTAHGSIPDAVQAMKLGAIDFITKPLTPERLRAVVADVVRRHSSLANGPVAQHADQPTTVTIAPAAIDLARVKWALNRRDFETAHTLLEEALECDPRSAEAHTLMGVLQECRGQQHAAYHSYKTALSADPNHGPALDNMMRYCERHNLDFRSKAINPAAHG